MALQTINIGSTANDGTGDTLRDAFDKTNDNFTELYNSGPTIDLDKYGVAPGNSAATNQAAIANVIASLKAASIPGFHLRLNRAGTFSLTRGTDGAGLALYETRKAAILLPSNCTFEMGPDTRLTLLQNESTYIIRNDDPINGNVNIAIKGGYLDGNCDLLPGSNDELVVGGQGFFGQLLWLENINRLLVEDLAFTRPGRWASCATKVHNFLFDRCFFDDCPRDGIHLSGGSSNGTIRDFRGECHDNAIAIATAACDTQGNPSTYFSGLFNWADGTLVAGSHYNILVDSPRFSNCNGPIALFGRPTEEINGVTIRNVRGSTLAGTSAYVVGATIYPTVSTTGCPIRDLVIDDVQVVTANTDEPQVILAGDVRSAVITNIHAIGGEGVRLTGTNYECVKVDNITNSQRATTASLLRFGNSATGQAFHAKSVQVGRVAAVMDGSSKEAINIQSNATWDDCVMDDVHVTGSALTKGIVGYGTTRRTLRINSLNLRGNIATGISGSLNVHVGHLRNPHCSELVNGGAYVTCNQIDPITGTCSVRSGGFLSGRGIVQRTVLFSDLFIAPANVTGVGTVKLPRGAFPTRFTVKAYPGMQGGAVTEVTCYLRRLSGTTLQLTTPVSVFDTNFNAAAPAIPTVASNAINAGMDVDFVFTSTTANLSELTQGVAFIELEYAVFTPGT